MPQRSRSHVPLECVITYRGPYVPRWWQVVIRRGQVFFRWYNETSEMPIDAQYLEMRWLKTSTNCWKVVPTPTRMACLFYDLAFLILPAWENEVIPNYSRRGRLSRRFGLNRPRKVIYEQKHVKKNKCS